MISEHPSSLPARGPLASLVHLGPSAVYIIYIFVSGTARHPGFPLHVSDKVMHFAAFGGMVPLLFLAVRYFRPSVPPVTGVVVSAVIASGLGAFLEFWQSFLPYRDADFLDWIADTSGAILFGAVVLALLGVVSRRRSSDRSA